MSNFYNQASWVLVPSGIEEDIVFAQKPISGLGDLTFTRASDATYTDASGVVRRSPYNLLQQSNTFNVTWVTALATVTSGQSGFDGTNNAWLLSKTNTDGRIGQSITLTSGAYTYSVYAKAGTKNWVFLRVDGTSNRTAYFNLQTGVTGTASGCTSSISSVGNGWYRCSITFTDSMTIARIYVADANNDTSGTSGNILIQAAQLVEGTSALDYFPTTNRQDVPRIDFRNADGTLSSCGRLLFEPQRTNSIRNSSMVGAVAGTPGTLPTNWDISSGGLTWTIVGTGTENGLPYIEARFNGTATSSSAQFMFETFTGIAASAAQSWSNSVYSKRISGSYDQAILVWDEFTSGVIFNATKTQNITLSTQLARYTQVNTISTLSAFVRPILRFSLTNGAAYDFTIRIAAPQMELGAYATTWVPTTTAAVTRLADAASKTGVSSLIGQTEGTLYWEGTLRTLSLFQDIFGAGVFADNVFIRLNSSNQIQAVATKAGIVNVLGQSTTITSGSFKIAFAYKNGSHALVINGGTPITSTATSVIPASMSLLNLGNMIRAATLEGSVSQAALFPTRLTNAELAQLTTL